MPAIRTPYISIFRHQLAPQYVRADTAAIIEHVDEDVTMTTASRCDTSMRSVSHHEGVIDEGAVSGNSTIHAPSPDRTSCRPQRQISASPSSSRSRSRSVTRNGDHSSQVSISPHLVLSQGSIYLDVRFPWVQDQSFLSLARSGQLAPIDLIRLVYPSANDTVNQHPSSGNVTTRSTARRFVHFFDTVPIFASAWMAYGEMMVDASVDDRARGKILNAISKYLRWLLNWTTTHRWAACMNFHHAIHLERICMGRFDPDLWIRTVDESIADHYFNAETALEPTRSASPIASTSDVPVPITVGPETQPHNTHMVSRASVLANRKRVAKALGVCTPWNERTCSDPCPNGYKHMCWVCGGSHTGRTCPKDRR